jgi:hypothetical protein
VSNSQMYWYMMAQTPGAKFCRVAPVVSSITIAVFPGYIKNVYRVTCTEQNSPENSEADRFVQNFEFSLSSLPLVTLPAHKFGGGF